MSFDMKGIKMKIDKIKDTRDTNGRAWLVYDVPPKDGRLRINISSRSVGNRTANEADCSVTIKNLTLKEHDAVVSMVNEQSYLRVKDGRLHAYTVHKPLPDAVDDPIVAPHWVKSTDELVKHGNYPKENGQRMPGIVISHLGAGIGERHFDNADTVKRNIEAVESCGFVCLRSKRFEDGTYDEKWVLHSLYCAKGPLKEFLDSLKVKADTYWHTVADAACDFLVKAMGIRFGTMDITIQRWALTCGD